MTKKRLDLVFWGAPKTGVVTGIFFGSVMEGS